MIRRIDKVETVEVAINSITSTRFYFGEQANLRGKLIKYIQAYTIDLITKTPKGKNCPDSTSEIKVAYLVLTSVVDKKEVINRIPLINLLPTRNYGFRNQLNLIVDWSKSYVEVATTSYLNTDDAFLFTVHYDDKPTGKESPLYCENIEVICNNITSTKFYFPKNENLLSIPIIMIDAGDSVSTLLGTPKQKQIVTDSALLDSYLVICSKGKEIIKMPLYALKRNVNLKRTYFDNIILDIDNCYVEVTQTTNLVLNEAWFFNFWYLRTSQKSHLIRSRTRTRTTLKIPKRPTRRTARKVRRR